MGLVIGFVVGSQIALFVMFLGIKPWVRKQCWEIQKELIQSNTNWVSTLNALWLRITDVERHIESKGEKIAHPIPPIIRNVVTCDKGIGV